MKLATTLEPRDVHLLRKLHAELGRLLDMLPTDVGAGRRSAASAAKTKRATKRTSSESGVTEEA